MEYSQKLASEMDQKKKKGPVTNYKYSTSVELQISGTRLVMYFSMFTWITRNIQFYRGNLVKMNKGIFNNVDAWIT